MLVVAFDTETTGLIPKCSLTSETVDMFPHLLQLSAVKYLEEEEDKHTISCFNEMVCLEEIPQESINIHGITVEMSQAKGKHIDYVLDAFFEFIGDPSEIDYLVAHNSEFDKKVVMCEILRQRNRCFEEKDNARYKTRFFEKNINRKLANNVSYSTALSSVHIRCTMMMYQYLPPSEKSVGGGGRWIKLVNLHKHCFGTVPNPEKMHDALNDTLVCIRCFYYMQKGVDLCDINAELRNYIDALL